MKAILSLAPFGFRSFHRAVLYPDSREDVVDAVRVDVNGRGLRPREFWNEAINLLRYMAKDAEAKQVQEALMEQTKAPSQTGSKMTTDEEIAQLVAEARLIEAIKRRRPDLDSLGSQQQSVQDKKV